MRTHSMVFNPQGRYLAPGQLYIIDSIDHPARIIQVTILRGKSYLDRHFYPQH